jgi:mRNA-degrading endonuclease RelE of RelBE toxin-antitoxin system
LPCFIHDQGTHIFQRQLKDLRKKYPKVDGDLAAAYEDIRQDHQRACYAIPINNFGGSIWRYRFASTDMQRGRSGGFRLMAYYQDSTDSLHPFCIHTKAQFEFPDAKELKRWIKECIDDLVHSPQPTDRP